MAKSLKKINNTSIVFCLSILVALAVYYKFLFFGHISWDDPEMVFKNKFVKNFDLYQLFSGHFVGNYIPLTMFTHAIGWFVFEGHDSGHHAINILFHLLNSILVFYTGKLLIKNNNIALAGMIVFLLHPVQMETVGWISELKNILSTTFYLCSIINYIIYANTHAKKNYMLMLVFFIMGCFSKSSVVVLPLSLVCVDIYLQKKITSKLFIDKIPLFIISLVFGIINIKAQTEDLFINYAHAFPYYQRIGYAGYALIRYMLMFIAPVNLSVIYPYPSQNLLAILLGYSFSCCLAFILYLTIKKRKFHFTALILFTLANLLLVLQFIPFGEVLYADRYMYIPTIGLAWIFASLLFSTKINPFFSQIFLLVLLGLTSFSRANVWRSSTSLYEDILHNFPNSFVALNSVGVEYMLRNNNEKAFYYLNKSIQVAPYNYKGYYNKGLFYLKNQKASEAIKCFNKSLDIYEYSKAFVGRASAYHMLGDIPNAMKDANNALTIEKNNLKAHFVLGNCYNDLNQLNEALAEYNQCLTLNDTEPDYYFKRAIVYGKKKEFEFCINDLNACLSLDPERFEAYYWIGVAKVNLKQNPCSNLKIAAEHNYKPAVDAYNRYCNP